MIKKLAILGIVIAGLLSAACFGAPKEPVMPEPTPPVATVSEHECVVYRMPADGSEWLVPEKVSVKGDKKDLPKLALEALIKTQPKSDKLKNIFPPGVELLSLWVEDGTAVADFSRELKNIPDGSYTELMLTTAMVDTLTEFPQIKRLRIYVVGKKVATLKGHVDLVDPLERNTDIIKK